ncbi:cupin domain-containing protein [Uliginosibacterium sp. H1]|uniref:cupin domain-containing protein n=1 Tax=Uliginosibacterium sp. H1 TaxID=3114757 RepID=UPI002E197601|nr:cupin domain-containing protein [Uliginosibacterium sp. H1]
MRPPTRTGNLVSPLPAPGSEEHFDTLLARPGLRLERIVSHLHASPPGFWYEQADDEWVLLVQGEAELAFDDGKVLALRAGDHVTIPAGCRHRVARTGRDTVWLALHVTPEATAPDS